MKFLTRIIQDLIIEKRYHFINQRIGRIGDNNKPAQI